MPSEFMLRVSWATNKHSDQEGGDEGQLKHCRRGEVMLDLGLDFHAGDDFTSEEMQTIAYATKMEALRVLRRRKRAAKTNRGTIMRIERNVVRVDKSPMNKKVKVVELDCGHDYYVRPPSIAPSIGRAVACDKCKNAANSGVGC